MTFSDINTPSGHICTCLLLVGGAGLGYWLASHGHDTQIQNMCIGVITGALGVIFRTMGVPNPDVKPVDPQRPPILLDRDLR